jgi:hypothetical protein
VIAEVRGRQRLAREIDGRVRRAEVEAHRRPREGVGENRGEQVLPRVLLRVVAATRGIYLAVHGGDATRKRLRERVHHARLLVDHVDDAHARERPGVVGLTAARRMKGRAIEHDAQAARVDRDDLRLEGEERRILLIEASRQRGPSLRRASSRSAEAASSSSP